jgi:hypothetical protein
MFHGCFPNVAAVEPDLSLPTHPAQQQIYYHFRQHQQTSKRTIILAVVHPQQAQITFFPIVSTTTKN